MLGVGIILIQVFIISITKPLRRYIPWPSLHWHNNNLCLLSSSCCIHIISFFHPPPERKHRENIAQPSWRAATFYQHRIITGYFMSPRQAASSTMRESPKITPSELHFYCQLVFYQHMSMLEYFMSLRQPAYTIMWEIPRCKPSALWPHHLQHGNTHIQGLITTK